MILKKNTSNKYAHKASTSIHYDYHIIIMYCGFLNKRCVAIPVNHPKESKFHYYLASSLLKGKAKKEKEVTQMSIHQCWNQFAPFSICNCMFDIAFGGIS